MSDNSNDRSPSPPPRAVEGHAHPDHRGRARRPDRRLPAGQAGAPGDRLRGRGPGRRHRQDRGPRRPRRQVPLRPRRPSLLHEGQGGRRPLARDHEGGVPRAAAHVAHLLAQPQGRGQVPRLPAARPGRAQEARPGRPDQGALLLPRGAPSGPRARRRPSSSGSPTASASGSSTSSSSPTPRRSGASRRPRSAPSGPPSASRTSRSSAPPGRRSSATRTTRSRA